jgi:hypothetical protein
MWGGGLTNKKQTKQTVCFPSHLTYLTLLRHFCTLLHFTLTYGDFRAGSPLFSLDFFFHGITYPLKLSEGEFCVAHGTSVSVRSSDDFSAARGRQLQHLPNLGGSGKHRCAQQACSFLPRLSATADHRKCAASSSLRLTMPVDTKRVDRVS